MSGKPKKRIIDEEGLFVYRDVVVTDDWYPCFDDNRIHVSLSLRKSGKNYVVLFSAYGADDFSVCMRYESDFSEHSNSVYYNWRSYIFERIPDGVNVEWFYEHGFYPD